MLKLQIRLVKVHEGLILQNHEPNTTSKELVEATFRRRLLDSLERRTAQFREIQNDHSERGMINSGKLLGPLVNADAIK